MRRGPIVLLTDFGLRDPFVGIMKGVILGLAPRAVIVDLCHEIAPQDVRGAALQLLASVPYFPAGTLFVAVVDPGVGSQRRLLWARGPRQQFLAPDNGVLSWVLEEENLRECRAVANQKLFLPEVSATFQGRDIFAPVAARLSRGLAPRSLGPAVRDMFRIPFPAPRRSARGVRGRIMAFDRFGNALTNLRRGDIARSARLRFGGRDLGRPATHYAQARPGEAAALLGSSGFLELSVRDGDFAKKFRARVGDAVESRA